MKQSVKQWFINHKPSKRRLIQIYAALLYNANIKGFISGNIYTSATTKYMCVPGLNCYSCPGAIGACPLGALQNSLAESGTRAPYYVLGILGIFGLMLARAICGFLCPIGLCQELLYKVRTPKVAKSRVTRVLSYFKYVLLFLAIALPLIYALRDVPLPAFCKYICPAGTFGGAIMLLLNPNNAGLFGQLGWQFTWKFSLLIFFIVASVFIYRFFCRFFCPLGAIYGFFNRFALLGVRVNRDSCTDCGLCVSHCKMDIKRVGDHECINCGECISVCPTKAISWKGSQIFLHKDAIDEQIPTLKPLAVENGVVSIPSNSIEYQEPQTDVVSDTMDKALDTQSVPVYYSAEETIDKYVPAPAKKPKKPVKFWVELTAWILALALLVTALVCYNFVDVESSYVPAATGTGYQIGNIAADFTVPVYGEDENFNLYANKGTKTVIYFWSTDSAASVEEIPYFNALAENHPEITVIAIHCTLEGPADATAASSLGDIDDFIDSMSWGEYKLIFAKDNVGTAFKAFGGTDTLPMTVAVNEDGVIVYNDTARFEGVEQLEPILSRKIGYEIGDIAPDFTVELYRTDGEFNLYSQRGKLTVVNFWATWCTPCVKEIPHFNELAEAHPEINVIAIHGSSTRDVEDFIASKGWGDYALTLAQDNLDGTTCLTFQAFGGASKWPMTVVVDADGTVVYSSTRAFASYEELENMMSEYLQN